MKDKLRDALERLINVEHDYPTDLGRSPEYKAAFANAKRVLEEIDRITEV